MKLSEAKQLFEIGTPLAEIARQAEVSMRDIKFALGVKSDAWLIMELYSQGLNDYEIAERMSCSISRIFNFRKREGLVAQRTKTPIKADQHRDLLLKMNSQGRSAVEMAEATGLSYGNVYYWLKKNGL